MPRDCTSCTQILLGVAARQTKHYVGKIASTDAANQSPLAQTFWANVGVIRTVNTKGQRQAGGMGHQLTNAPTVTRSAVWKSSACQRISAVSDRPIPCPETGVCGQSCNLINASVRSIVCECAVGFLGRPQRGCSKALASGCFQDRWSDTRARGQGNP